MEVGLPLHPGLGELPRRLIDLAPRTPAVNLLVQRVATSEALFETRFDQLAAAIAALKG